MQATFNHISEVDQMSGSITLHVFFDIYWKRRSLSQMDVPENSPNVPGILVLIDSPWHPDLKIWNGDPTTDNMDIEPIIVYSSDGAECGEVLFHEVMYNCDMDLRLFLSINRSAQ
jgi:hypothetical protein